MHHPVIRVSHLVAAAVLGFVVAFPAGAVTTGFDYFKTVYVFDTPGPGGLIMDSHYRDYTAEASDGVLRDVPLGGDEVGDAVYFGDELPFWSIELDIGEAAPGGGVKWEYWNGTTFTDIVTVTEQFHRTGAFRHDFTPPANWSKRSILGGDDRYWLRVVWTGVPAAPLAKLNQASGLFYNFTFKAQNQDAAVITNLVQSDFTVDACNNGNNAVYGFSNRGAGEYYLALTTGAGCRVTIRASGYETFGPRAVGTLSNFILVNGGIYTLTVAAPAPPPPPPPPSPASPPLGASFLMKLACPLGVGVNDPCKEVFYVDVFGTRHSFPNQAVFFTWYPAGFASVAIQTVSPATLVSYALGRNVTHRPGVKLVKSPSNQTVYAATKGDASFGMLRVVATPEIAEALYGVNWARSVTDFSDVFMVNSYRVGVPITNVADYNVAVELSLNTTIDASMGR